METNLRSLPKAWPLRAARCLALLVVYTADAEVAVDILSVALGF